jgi:ABC-2 type transport system permease protein
MKITLIRLREMLIKEFIQVYRDPRMRFVLVMPLVAQILLYGYAASYSVHTVPTALIDLDHSQESRDLLSRFSASHYFEIVARPRNDTQLRAIIDHGTVTTAIEVLPGFARKLRDGQNASVLAALDGTNSNTALLALGYINEIGDRFARDYRRDYFERRMPQVLVAMPPVVFEQRPWFNQDLESRWFFVPGTIGLLMMAVVTSLTAFAIVREREIGTLEQIMVSPMRAYEFILGKTLPNFFIALGQLAVVTLIGLLWFQVPFRGAFATLLVGSLLYLISLLAIGLLVSTVSANQQQALMACFFAVLPASILSGFSFPISSMPEALQWLTYADPLRYYLVVVRSVFLKGSGIGDLWFQMTAMGVLGCMLLAASIVRFHKRLD